MRDAAGAQELLLELGRGADDGRVAQIHRVAMETHAKCDGRVRGSGLFSLFVRVAGGGRGYFDSQLLAELWQYCVFSPRTISGEPRCILGPLGPMHAN